MKRTFARIKHDYVPNNFTDRIKHRTLEEITRALLPDTYIECHSGCGVYQLADGTTYRGSTVRVLDILQAAQTSSTAYLHEIKLPRRQRLNHAVQKYGCPLSHKNYKHCLAADLAQAKGTTLVLLDPTDMSDYDATAFKLLDPILKRANALYLFAPVFDGIDIHHKKLSAITCSIALHGRDALDIVHPAGNTGCYQRHDHHIIVAPPQLLTTIEEKVSKGVGHYIPPALDQKDDSATELKSFYLKNSPLLD